MTKVTDERTAEVIMFALDALEKLAAAGMLSYQSKYKTNKATQDELKKLEKAGKAPSQEEIEKITQDLIDLGYVKITMVARPR